MKRGIVSGVLALLLLTACGAKPAPTTAPASEPAARTKTVYVRKESTVQNGGTVTRTEYVFDDAEQVCQVNIYTDDVQTQQYGVECDENGNYILWRSGQREFRYTYDPHGHLLSYGAYIGDTMVSSTEYTWENGHQTGILRTVQDQQQRTVLTYDEAGRVLRQDNFTGSSLTDYWVYTMGEDGRAATMTVYLADGTAQKTVRYAYSGNTVTATAEDGGYSQQIYDDRGNLLSDTEYTSEGEIISRQTNTWIALELPVDSVRASM